TGCGVIAIFSAFKGASRIVAVDINPGAIKSARANAERFGFKKIIDTRLSDMFAAIKPDEKFDVI
ncbi:MAG: tRNA (adenine(22)-N(1))-methyltransferase TrmK, partial [Candidatus Aenigmarchaeota archaeon]|nr:tRNA (adenine(22)-N(1))-methyltransferase TrmK [Candidatus Aenigmarchaeota archaeon]